MIQAIRNRWFNGGDTYIGLEWIPVTRLNFPVNNLAKEENRLNILRKSDDGLPVTSIGYYVSPIAIVKSDPEYAPNCCWFREYRWAGA